MFKVNDYIMYGLTGVCQVVDITKESFINNLQKEYYVLKYIYDNDTIIKIPTDNEKIPMRKLLSKEDMATLINSMPNSETIWIDNDRQRNEEFKSILKTGDTENLVKLIRSIYLDKEHKQSIGKKLYKVDDEIMQTAERLLNEEFATILNISPDEVATYISTHIPQ
ncbi:CarD transcriptional regulator [Romboutsia ilealis]|uniref:CarD transcriptional regulator n=1 Tax=Romboutsia ilealis TaxID=1115758 RepID=A0A1V1I077_9FIRM|nr:CarD family transcriptional regulator [Romboutsia ilealis]CED93626.1 CarD transcriptional regulator [Romboutsia ilealis]